MCNSYHCELGTRACDKKYRFFVNEIEVFESDDATDYDAFSDGDGDFYEFLDSCYVDGK